MIQYLTPGRAGAGTLLTRFLDALYGLSESDIRTRLKVSEP